MKGCVEVDGVDVAATFGLVLSEGSYASLLSYPPLKEPEQNDWAECDGVEVDLSSPKLDKAVRRLNFCSFNSRFNADAFFDLLLSKSKHLFRFPYISYEVELGYVSCDECSRLNNGVEINLSFLEGRPLQNYSYLSPVSMSVPYQGLFLDGMDISCYGIQVLEGTRDSITRYFSAKPLGETASKVINGVISDTFSLRRKSNEITLKLLLKAKSVELFLCNYYAFLHDLIQPSERVLQAFGKTIKCYYKRSEIVFLSMDESPWCEFNVVLCFTGV